MAPGKTRKSLNPTGTPTILEIKNARVMRKETCVFKNLSLQIPGGESLAILGPNGAGKSTFLKLLTRELYPVVKEHSYLKLFGKELINIWDLRKRIGIVSHEYQIAYEAVATGLDVVLSAYFGSVGVHGHHQVRPHQREHAMQYMDSLNIANLRNKQYLQLSTGQQRRLLLARALIHEPEVLIFDEPTNGLDIPAAFQILNDIRHWCGPGKTLILVTHHIQEVIPEITRVVLLKKGAVFADGEKSDVLTSEQISLLYDCPIELHESAGYYHVTPK